MIKIKDTSAQDIAIKSKARDRKFWFKLAGIGVPALIVILILIQAISRLLSADISVSRERLRTALVERGDFVRDLTAQGKIIAAVSPSLYASADGVVTLQVKAGDAVEKGQILASLESPELLSRYAQEQSTLGSMQIEVARQRIQTKKSLLKSQQTIDLAQVRLTAAKREQERAQLSIEKQVIRRIDYEKAMDDLNAANVEHKHAIQDAVLEKESLQFELKTKELQLNRQKLLVADLKRQKDELQVRSPVKGVIGNLAVQQKAAVIRNTALMTVVDLSVYEIEVSVPETYADDLGIGMKTEITFNQTQYSGELTAVSPEVINSQVVARMRFVGNMPEGLRQSQRVTTRILIESRKNITKVQRGAFLESSAGRYVYVVQNGLAKKMPVRTGSRGVNEVEILEGLTPGQEIVISNTEIFKEAETVYLTN